MSMSFIGSTPYFSRTASGVYLSVTGLPIFVAASRTLTLSDTNCRLSLSPVAIVQTASPLWRERVPRISSASYPGFSTIGTPIASSSSLSTGICCASSSGIPFLVAL